MAYTVGTSANTTEFLVKLVAFAASNGFTNENSVVAADGRTVHRLSKGGGVTWYFAAQTSNAGFVGRMGYSNFPVIGGSIDAPGTAFQASPTQFTTWAFTNAFVQHYFFASNGCVHAVVEISAGIYNHISFGTVTKWGNWPGGEYLTAGYYNSSNAGAYRDWNSNYHCRPFNDLAHSMLTGSSSYIRAQETSIGTDFKSMQGGYNSTCGMFVGIGGITDGEGPMYTQVMRDSPSQFTARSPIFPGLVRRYDYEQNSGLSSLAGVVPNVGFVKFTQDMNAKDLINVNWQIFPITVRTGGDQSVASTSYEYALAYKRV